MKKKTSAQKKDPLSGRRADVLLGIFIAGLFLTPMILIEVYPPSTGLSAIEERHFFLSEEGEGVLKNPQSLTEESQKELRGAHPQKPLHYKYLKTLRCKVTAYTPNEESCGKFTDGFTSTGQNAWHISGVAAEPKILPYGSLVYIPKVGYREVDDTGIAMRQSWKNDGEIHLDLRMSDVLEAQKWGVRELNIHIYEEDKSP